jgi:hypothetical protein
MPASLSAAGRARAEGECKIKNELGFGMDNRMLISTGLMDLIRSLAVELNALNGLDDQALERIERRAIQKIKGTEFYGTIPQEDEQIRLLDISIGAVRTGIKYIKDSRDNGDLTP